MVAARQPKRVANRYRLIRKLGEGGMGTVYLAKDLRQGSDSSALCALKFLPPFPNDHHIDRFKKEFEFLTRLSHPHLVQVFDFGFDSNRKQYFFVSEYVKGENIFQATRNKKPEEIYPLLGQICEVLIYIHRLGILHNDLKPSNIYLSNQKSVGIKIFDFGISSFLEPNHDSGQLHTGGTPGYMAPEVIKNRLYHVASDIFSLGMVFYKIFAGSLPLANRNQRDILIFMSQNEIPTIDQFKPELTKTLPKNLIALITKLTAFYALQRPQSAELVFDTIERLSGKPIKKGKKATTKQVLYPAKFVGRQIEIKQILGFIEQKLSASDPSKYALAQPTLKNHFIQIAGLETVGKSRLLRELAIRLQLKDVAICRGTCQKNSNTFCQPWGEILVQISQVGDEEIPLSLSRAYFEKIDISSQVSDSPPQHFLEPKTENEQWRIFHIYGALIRKITSRLPLVICIDDLHLADSESLKLLAFLLRFCRKKILFIVTHQSNEKSIVDFCMKNGSFKLDLHPLTLEDIRHLVAMRLGLSEIPMDIAQLIHNQSQGNPLVIESILFEAINSKWLKYKNHAWQLTPNLAEKLRKNPGDLLGHRLEQLEKTQKDFLVLCAIFQEPFQPRELAMLSNQSLHRVVAKLEEQIQSGFLLHQGPQHYSWKQKNIAHFLYQSQMGKPRSAKNFKAMHQKLAIYLSQRPNESEINIERIFQHFQAADDFKQACQWALRIAEEALQKAAFGRAERALSFVQNNSKHLKDAEQRQLSILMIHLLLAQRHNNEAFEHLDRLMADNKLDSNQSPHLLLILSRLCLDKGNFKKALVISNKAQGILKRHVNEPLNARVLAQMALCESFLGHFSQAIDLASKAIEKGKAYGDNYLTGQLINKRGNIYLTHEGYLDQAAKDFLLALDYFNKTGDHLNAKTGLTLTYSNLALAYGQKGDLNRQGQYVKKSLELARSIGDIQRIFHCLKNSAAYSYDRGDYIASKIHYLEALDLAKSLTNQTFQADIYFNLSRIESLQGQFEQCFSNLKLGFDLAKNLKHLPINTHGMLYQLFAWLQLGNFKKIHDHITLMSNRPDDPLIQASLHLIEGECAIFEGSWKTSRSFYQKAKHVFEKNNLDSHLYKVDQGLLLSDLYHHKAIESEQLKGIQAFLQNIRFNEKPLEILKSKLLLLEANLNLDRKKVFSSDLETFQIDHAAQIKLIPDLDLDLQYLLAKFYLKLNQPKKAMVYLERANQIISEISTGLSTSNQKFFLKHPRRQRLIELYTEQRSQNAFIHLENTALKTKITAFEKLHETYEHLEKSKWSLEKAERDVLHCLLEITHAERGILFLYDGEHLEARLGLKTDAKEINWKVPKTLKQKLQEAGETLLMMGQIKLTAGFLAIPLYRFQSESDHGPEEELPFGMIALGGDAFIADEDQLTLTRGLMTKLGFFIATMIYKKFDESQMKSIILTTSQELKTAHTEMLSYTNSQSLRYNFSNVIGHDSHRMAETFELLEKIIPSSIPVIIQGESGTGKELMARIIHANGPFSDKPLVVINCGSLDHNLFESNLFGHEKGAFTGAEERRDGLLALGNGGTILFKEICDLPLELQSKLLRVLETGEYRPLGSDKVLKSKFRIISASHQDLDQMVQSEKLRSDLFYRLSGITLKLPALRERREDIPNFIKFFLREIAEKDKKKKKSLTARGLKALTYYEWPGNVRQLKNTIELLTLVTSNKKIDLEDLPPEILKEDQANTILPLNECKAEFMKDYIEKLLSQTGGNVTQAAKLAGVKREYVHYLIRTHLKS